MEKITTIPLSTNLYNELRIIRICLYSVTAELRAIQSRFEDIRNDWWYADLICASEQIKKQIDILESMQSAIAEELMER